MLEDAEQADRRVEAAFVIGALAEAGREARAAPFDPASLILGP
jgi:hypothetical protein